MDYIGLILKLAETGLGLWAQKDARKYLDELISLRQEYYEEFNKPLENRDDARLDRIEFRINILCESFASAVGAKNTENK